SYVITWVGIAVSIRRRDKRHKLMRDLVGEWVANHREIRIRLECSQDKVDHLKAVGPFEITTLFHIGVLVDHSPFQGCEVARSTGYEVVRDVFLRPIFTGSAGWKSSARRSTPCNCARERGVIEFELARVGRERNQFHIVTNGLVRARTNEAVCAHELNWQKVADLEIDRGQRAGFAYRANDDVIIVHCTVSDAVIEIDVIGSVWVL